MVWTYFAHDDKAPLGLPVPKFKVEFRDAVDLIDGLPLANLIEPALEVIGQPRHHDVRQSALCRYKRWKVSAMTTIVGIFDSTRDMDRAVERLAEAGFEDTVYDDAIVALEAVNVGPIVAPVPVTPVAPSIG